MLTTSIVLSGGANLQWCLHKLLLSLVGSIAASSTQQKNE